MKAPVYYQVRPGDTVWNISKKYGVDNEAILLLNDLHNPQELEAGRTILVGYRYGAQTARASLAAPRQKRPAKMASKSTPTTQPVLRRNSSGQDGELLWPVSSGRVVSSFGPRSGSFHDGLDISTPEGTSIFAAHSGTVIYSGDKLSGYGNLIILRHSSGLTSVYAHNSKVFVTTGDKVKRGENIGEVGSTGHATGPHLHFEIRMRDQQGRYVAVDPVPLLNGETNARPRYRVNEGLTPILAALF